MKALFIKCTWNIPVSQTKKQRNTKYYKFTARLTSLLGKWTACEIFKHQTETHATSGYNKHVDPSPANI